MRRKHIGITLILTFLTLLAFAAASTLIMGHSITPDHVRAYVYNSASSDNIYPALNYPTPTYVFVYIDAPDSWAHTSSGIVGVTISLRVNPAVVEVLSAMAVPDGDFDGYPDSFLGKFCAVYWWDTPFFTKGTVDKPTGTITETAEAVLGFTTLGVGAGGGPEPLWRYVIRTQSGVDASTAYSPLTLFDAYYTTWDGTKHAIEIVDHGHYGTPPQQYFMSGPALDLTPTVPPYTPATITDPIGTSWHELYPTYCQQWDLTSWTDNGDGYLSASDQIDMTQISGSEPGYVYWYHVDAVTVTIHWTFKVDETTPTDPAELGFAEGPELTEPVQNPLTDPIGTAWHQIYPEYSKEFVITSWIDSNADGKFSPSDQFDFEYFGEGVTQWAHLDDVTTDIILSFKDKEPPVPEFPLGIGLILTVALAIPVVYVWRRKR